MLSFLDRRKQTKMQWLQDPNQSSLDNVKLVDISGTKKGVSER